MSDPKGLPRVSHSWKTAYNWCPRQFKYIYIDKAKPDRPKVITASVGTGVHKIVNRMYLANNFSLSWMLEQWPIVYYEQLKKDGITFKNPEREKYWLDKGNELLIRFHKVAEKEGFLVPAIRTEWRFRLTLVDMVLIGIVDLIIKVDGKVGIWDLKSGLTEVEDTVLSPSEQLTIYSLAARRLLLLEEQVTGFIYPQHDKIVVSPVQRGNEDYFKLLAEVREIVKKVENKEFEPTYKDCQRCLFAGRCRAEDTAKKTGISMKWFYPTVEGT